jgi:alpha-galactosidase
MTPAPGIGLDIERIESDAEQLRKLTGEWRSIAGLYYGDYYPLTPYSTEPTAWLAWQFNDPAAHSGMIQAFRRPESPFESARFRLSGLNAEANYAVRDLDFSAETRYTGKSLMEAGLAVNIGHRPGVVVLVYHKAE